MKYKKYYKNEPRFNGVYSRDNLAKIKDGAYVISRDEYSDIGTHWAALYLQNNTNNVIYFDSFGVEQIPKEITAFINNNNNNNNNNSYNDNNNNNNNNNNNK